ncbi:YncE family protein [Streptomyces sp. ZAF1911]|uniref:YncE family protein n=1 Tax=Streptomyces sp. ZAF1911 TaxID=2944129 RepID=UPI00237B4347|nr:YncE family protein [Streptomyces sp. ZAF1911]MDD9375701.1 YncE family protein [Streptomyces sp. ZAF1911]
MVSAVTVLNEPVREPAGPRPAGGRWLTPARGWVAGLAVLASVAAPASAATTPPLGAQSGTFAYVANGGSDRLAMINTADNTVTGTFAVSTEPNADPNGVAVSPDGRRVYVANALANTMAIVFPADDSFLSVDVGNNPTAVAVSADGSRAYVTNQSDGSLSVINTVDVPVSVTTFDVGNNPQDLALAVNGTKAYIAIRPSFDVGAVAVVDTVTNTVERTIPVGSFPQGVAANPDGTRVYVTNFGDGTVSVIDTANDTVVGTIDVGGGTTSPADVAVSPDGRRAYTANFGAGNVSVIDLTVTPPAVIANVDSGQQPMGVAVTPDSSRVYVTSSGNDSVSAIDAATHTVIEPPIDGFDIPLGVAVGTRTVGAAPAGLTLKVRGNGKDEDAPGTSTGSGATLKARLTSGGRPLAGEEILFSTGSKVLCIERADGRGEAACAVPGGKSAPDCYRATFLGTATHAATRTPACHGHDRRRP